ncbi:helix-turn-helix domain-containing protein [Piscicoccus intestinalis]|uniref:helix-turn-helix domain-containing protein n=1 Tax=Piscicoccus intestinalis TaxID=746033 RepID=UPI0008386EDD|nr:GAF domain-containing protein [Piscicoccus intestinalis]
MSLTRPEAEEARVGWLELLLRDASIEELTAFGASRSEQDPEELVQALRIKAMLAQRAQRARALTSLNGIAGRLLSLRSPGDLLPEIVDQVRHLLRVDLAYLGLVYDDPQVGQVLRLEVTSGALTPDLVGLRVPMDRGLAGVVLTQAKPLWCTDYLTDSTFRHDGVADAAATAENMHGLLAAPLTVRGRMLGALFASERSPREFEEDEVTLLCAFAAHAGIALDNADRLASLESAKDELAHRTAELEQILEWDRRLTDVVLAGGSVDDILAEASSAVGGDVRFAAGDAPAHDGPAAPVAAGSRRLGTLTMSADHRPGPADLLVLDRAAPVVALAVLAERAEAEASARARHLGLLELLTTTATDDAQRRRQARLAGLDPSRVYCLAVVASAGEDVAATRARVAALPWPRSAGVVVHEGRVVVLAPHDSPDEAAGLLRRESDLAGGVAGPVAITGSLRACLREAVDTLGVATSWDASDRVLTSDRLGVYRVLLSHAGRTDVEAAFTRTLGPVTDAQRRSGVPLLETMRVFLDHGRSPRAAAGALGVHVNTVYQRIDTIDRLISAQWRQPGPAVETHMLLRLRGVMAGLTDAM